MSRLDMSLRRVPAAVLIGAMMLLQFAFHLPFFDTPPIGQHTWRQVIGESAARNFYEEDNHILFPKSDVRVGADDPGYLIQEFPLVYWLVGQSYFLTGFQHANGRVISFALAMSLLFLVYLLMIRLGASGERALLATYFLACSPLYFYYDINLLPELPALALFLASIICLATSVESGSLGGRYSAGVLCLVLATLTKATYLFFGLPVAWIFVDRFLASRKSRALLQGFVAGTAVLGANTLFYLHTLNITAAAPPERQNIITIRPPAFPDSLAEAWRIFEIAFPTWFVEVVVGYAALPMFVAGLYWAFAGLSKAFEGGARRSFARRFWWLWLVSFLAFGLRFYDLFEFHDYYLTSTLPLVAAIWAFGCERLLRTKFRKAVVFLLVLMPFLGFGRVYGRWTEHKQVPVELLDKTSLAAIAALLPPGEPVIIVGDSTPSVYLYYLHRKGVVKNEIDLPELRRLSAKGHRRLVQRRKVPMAEEVARVLRPTGEVGDFVVYEVGRE